MRGKLITAELSWLPAVQSRLNYGGSTAALNQVVVLQVALQDVVLHCAEDKSNVVCVCGAGEVGVDDFFLVWIEADKHI